MFIVPSNLMERLAARPKKIIRMGEAQKNTQGHAIA